MTGSNGGGATGLVLVRGMDPGEIEPGDDIDQEEDQVILRELGGRGAGLLSVELGVPRAIGFGASSAHDRPRMRMEEIDRVRPLMLKRPGRQNHHDPQNRQAVSGTAS